MLYDSSENPLNLLSKRCLLQENVHLKIVAVRKKTKFWTTALIQGKKRVNQFRLKDVKVQCLSIIELGGCGAREANAVTLFQISRVFYNRVQVQ